MRILLGVLSVIALASVIAAHQYWSRYTHDPLLIAHAGGAVEGRSYTNSHDALTFNGTDYWVFEIDLSWTSDGHLVCIHNWQNRAERTFGRRFDVPPTLAAFERLADLRPFDRNCTAASLMAWLEERPGTRLVTDIKSRNLEGLAWLAQRFPHLQERIIPQIFDPSHHGAVKSMGYEQVILALYRTPGTLDQIAAMLANTDIKTISIAEERLFSGLPLALKERDWPYQYFRLPFPERMRRVGIVTYAHTVNSLTRFVHLRRSGVAGIFTDRIICPPDTERCTKKPYPGKQERAAKQARATSFMAKAAAAMTPVEAR